MNRIAKQTRDTKIYFRFATLGESASELATEYKLTVQQIYRIIKKEQELLGQTACTRCDTRTPYLSRREWEYGEVELCNNCLQLWEGERKN